MIDGKILVEKLIKYAQNFLGFNECDTIYKRNELLWLFGLTAACEKVAAKELALAADQNAAEKLMAEIVTYATEQLSYDDKTAERFAVRIFGTLSPLPSVVDKQFKMLRERFSSAAACKYLFELLIHNYYIKKSELDKNLLWTVSDGSEGISLSVNMSKPEIDNKEIERNFVESAKSKKYPKCSLCRENEGFFGTDETRAMSNLRVVGIELNNENWFMTYSPYGYINEHFVVTNPIHTPMKIEKATADRLFDFIEYLPHYFIGSNADLPIIGSSVLSHEHYQGGVATMPLYKARIASELSAEKYPDVEISLMDWFSGDIRLSSYNRNTISQLFAEILEEWRKYCEPSLSIFNNPEKGEAHNSVTVVARYLEDGRYSLDVILRNNAVSEVSPQGIFHVPTKYLNIKKEGIGIMEVMGLFVLPARLKSEMNDICAVLLNTADEEATKRASVHSTMINEISAVHTNITSAAHAEEFVHHYIGNACMEILKNVSVFKKEESGIIGLRKFLAQVGIK